MVPPYVLREIYRRSTQGPSRGEILNILYLVPLDFYVLLLLHFVDLYRFVLYERVWEKRAHFGRPAGLVVTLKRCYK